MGMVDITQKPPVRRQATAEGSIFMRETTLEKIKEGDIKKGDPFTVAEIAALQALKSTSELIPFCHNVPIEGAEFVFRAGGNYVTVECRVSTTARTGVEMEALVGVSTALNTIWDMVKYLEKEDGLYPRTYITDIRVTDKKKGGGHGQPK